MIQKRNTKQRYIVIEYLKKNADKHLTVEEISSKLLKENVSQATIYRTLNSLTEEGILKKIFIADKKACCYQYINIDKKCTEHYHLICNTCGCILHFEEHLVNTLKENLLKQTHFTIDTQKLVFYGTCKKCSKGGI